MEILQNFWNAISTEDENLIRYVILCLSLIENYVMFKLFTTLLDINYSNKQKNIYFIIMFIYAIITGFLLPQKYGIFVTLFVIPITIKFTFKTSVLKSFLAEVIPLLITVLLEGIYIKLCLILFKINYDNVANIIIYRVPIVLMIYLTIFIISKLITAIKINSDIFDELDSTHKKILFFNLLFILISIGSQFYLLLFYNAVLPLFITLISLLSLLTYAAISIYSIIKSFRLELTQKNLEQSELHNKTLELLYNNVSSFKHDFSNILTALGGFIYANNMDGLKNYYNKILDECNINNNLSTLNPKVINNPAIYNILATKYYKADELGITINLQVFINLNELTIDIYSFCRMLGILLDNAIEASNMCDDKVINIDIRDIKPRKCKVISIENTYLDKDIDISKLYEKGYTSKTDNKEAHGIGLWQISKMLKKYDNVFLETSKNENYFKQDLFIYYT